MIVCSGDESGQFQENSCPEFLWQAGFVGCTNEGVEYSLGMKGFKVVLPYFHLSSIFLGGGGVFILI